MPQARAPLQGFAGAVQRCGMMCGVNAAGWVAAYLSLDPEDAGVVEPYPRHLVHEDQRSLEGVVQRFVCRVRDAFVLDLVLTLSKIHVPQLVAP